MTDHKEMTQQEMEQENEDFNRSFSRRPDFGSMDGEGDFHPSMFGDVQRYEDENSIQCILTGSPSKPELRELRWRNPEAYESYLQGMKRELGGWYKDWAKEFLP